MVGGTGLEIYGRNRNQLPSLLAQDVEPVFVCRVQPIVFGADIDDAIFPADLFHAVLPPVVREDYPNDPADRALRTVYHSNSVLICGMQMKKTGCPRLSLVIPALNEEDRLPSTLETIWNYLKGADDLLPAEVIVVDDGSSDRTAALTADFCSSPSLKFSSLRHPQTLGKGAAVRTGFGFSSGGMVLISDADLSAPINQIRVLLEGFSRDSVTIGSRAVDRRLISTRQPLYRDLMGRSFNILVQALLLPGIHDSQCGFKLFPGGLARALAGVQILDGFAFDVELLYLSRFWGFEIREIGVRWAHVEDSRVFPGRHSRQMLRDLLGLALRRISHGFPLRPEGV